MSRIHDLADILGSDCVFDDEETLHRYSSDQSFVQPRIPEAVAFAGSAEQVQKVIRYANRTATPLVPYSSGLNLHGATIPREGGFAEVDNYPDPTNPEEIQKAAGYGVYGMARLVKEKVCPCLMAFLSVEPFTTMFPEVGPNQTLLFRKIRTVFDPNSVNAPGRQVYTEQEWENAPDEVKQLVNKMREMVGLEAVQ